MTFTRFLRISKLTKSGAHYLTLLAGLNLLFLCPTNASAQEVGASLFGRVTDPAGAAVPEASVTITNRDTGKTASVKTQSDGSYVVTSLTPGTYTVSVEHTGFKKSVQTGITLVVFQK